MSDQTPSLDYLIDRYSRQLVLPRWSLKKQQKLAECCLVLGPEFYLGAIFGAAAGIGAIYFPAPISETLRSQLLDLSPKLNLIEKAPEAGDFSYTAQLSKSGEKIALTDPDLSVLFHLEGRQTIFDVNSKLRGHSTVQALNSLFITPNHVISLTAVSILLNDFLDKFESN